MRRPDQTVSISIEVALPQSRCSKISCGRLRLAKSLASFEAAMPNSLVVRDNACESEAEFAAETAADAAFEADPSAAPAAAFAANEAASAAVFNVAVSIAVKPTND